MSDVGNDFISRLCLEEQHAAVYSVLVWANGDSACITWIEAALLALCQPQISFRLWWEWHESVDDTLAVAQIQINMISFLHSSGETAFALLRFGRSYYIGQVGLGWRGEWSVRGGVAEIWLSRSHTDQTRESLYWSDQGVIVLIRPGSHCTDQIRESFCTGQIEEQFQTFCEYDLFISFFFSKLVINPFYSVLFTFYFCPSLFSICALLQVETAHLVWVDACCSSHFLVAFHSWFVSYVLKEQRFVLYNLSLFIGDIYVYIHCKCTKLGWTWYSLQSFDGWVTHFQLACWLQ